MIVIGFVFIFSFLFLFFVRGRHSLRGGGRPKPRSPLRLLDIFTCVPERWRHFITMYYTRMNHKLLALPPPDYNT